MSNACGTLWNLSARNSKDQEALWEMGAVSMLKNLIHSKHKMIAMGSAAALRNLMANRPAKYKDTNIMSPGSSLPSLHVRKQKALIEELDAQQLSETFDNLDNLSPKASHRNKPRHKHNIYGDYDGVCQTDGYNAGNVGVRSPYINTPVLSSPSSRDNRGNPENVRTEKDKNLDRERRGLHPDPDSGKRIGMQISTTAAQIAMVMEEVQSVHLGLDDRNTGSNSDPHAVPDDMIRRQTVHMYTFGKQDTSGRPVPMPKLEYRASSDSLNSVNSTDGYGKRGQMKPVDSYSEDDESKCCVYRKYPADLAHKIHNANHMEDDDGDLDTPINYSLKYSDEQLNSGRQSPNQSERWARPKILEDDLKRSDHKPSRSQSPGYPMYPEGNGDAEDKYQSMFVQQDMPGGFRSRGPNEQNSTGSSHGMNKKMNQTICTVVDDFGDDKPTNYSERYSEEEQLDEQPTNYSIKFNEDHHIEQPIDYSQKYSDTSSKKSLFSHSKTSPQSSVKDQLSQDNSSSVLSMKTQSRSKQLPPSSAQNRPSTGRAIQKTPTVNHETLQTYCVEDTPICFSRGSSLSSLSSEDELDSCKQNVNVGNNYPTVSVSEKPSNNVTDQRADGQSSGHYVRMKPPRHQGHVGHGDGSRHHRAVEVSSGVKSPSKSGAQTPKSPPEHYVQETPLVFSRCTSVSSLDSFESHSIASSVQSEPCSGMVSGIISPSDLPDSPGQTMPPSRNKTPPPPPPRSTSIKQKVTVLSHTEKRGLAPRHAAVNAAVQKVQVLPDNDTFLHFATESTPEGFSCASSLSALSLDEPFIQKDGELKIMPPVHEDDHMNLAEPEKEESKEKPLGPTEPEKDMLDDSDDDDDIEILEACINSAMPTKSSRKPKKQTPQAATRIPPPVARKTSQLPVYKLLPSQNRIQQQKHIVLSHGEDMPRVYCVEGTPTNFSTATSLSDLTIDSPPNELAIIDIPMAQAESRRDTIPEGKSAETQNSGVSLNTQSTSAENEGDDILAECINSAMPKGKIHKPFRVQKMSDQPQHPPTATGGLVQQEIEKKKPTSPVKPMPQSSEYRAKMIKRPELSSNLSESASYADENAETKRTDCKIALRGFAVKPAKAEERARPGFTFDSPHHYTPIEGTPYCFSRNDSLSSLDFDDDDLDLSKERAELRKNKEHRKAPPSKSNIERSENANRVTTFQSPSAKPLQNSGYLMASKENTGPVPDEKQNFAIEDTPVCFSRNSSLSSLSDIDQENNNKECSHKDNPSQLEIQRPQVSGYAPKAFHVEDTPVCFSRNSSLSSLSIDSEDDLLQECISSAMPKKKKQPPRSKSDEHEVKEEESLMADGILAEEPDLILDLTDTHSPISEQALSPDSESFDWKAIQEGANSIVSSLHQAAASLSRQGSSDSDSILSLKSGISIGSPFHLPTNQDDNKIATQKGPRILKPGEKSILENKKKDEEAAKSLKGGKKVYKSLITGKPRPSVDSVASQQRQSQATVVPRGRTMVHVPGVRSSSPSTSPIPKKPPVRGQITKPSIQGPNSGNSPRNIKTPPKSDPSPARESPVPHGGSNKTPSRSGSRESTPSRPSQQSMARPMQSPGRNSVSPGRNSLTPNKFSQIPRTVSPSAASKPPGSGRMSYPSSGRPLGQQTPPKQTGLPRSASAIPRSESSTKSLSQSGATGPTKKTDFSRMSSTKSSGSESDRSEKPGLVRQSTFIKEAPSPTLKRKLEESASFESLSPSSTSQSQTPVSSPSLPDMSLSLPYQAGNWRKSPQSQNSSENGDGKSPKRQDISRSHSESPSRLPVNKTGTWKREHSKHSSSLPRVGTWKRTGSSSSILSASSESSDKGRSEDERQPTSTSQRSGKNKEGGLERKGTWRKMKENETGTSLTLDLTADSAGFGTAHQISGISSKSEDVWVRIEDCPINSPRSGKSPTGNTPPVIDSFSGKLHPSDWDLTEMQHKQTIIEQPASRRPGSETNLNLMRSCESLEKKLTKPVLSHPNIATEVHELTIAERTPFSSTNSSKHSSPSGAVAARVSPFNYTPSPRKSSVEGLTPRPSQIPTPVSSNVKKRDSKSDTTESGSYIVTSV